MISTSAFAQGLASRGPAAANTTAQSAGGLSAGVLALADRQAVQREIPWYERFTNSAAPSATFGDIQPVGPGSTLPLSPSGRWGVSLDTRQRDASTLRTIRDEAAISAYFQFTPRLRVSGRLSVTEQARGGATAEAPASSVRIESAFKF